MGRIKTLIVEDDKNIIDLYEESLDNATFEKRFTGNGEEGLELYKAWHPEILILDIMLPLMTGYAVLKEIRSTLLDDKTTIIMATSLRDSRDIQDCMKLGIQGYIIKPFKLDELGNRIVLYHQSHRSSRSAKGSSH